MIHAIFGNSPPAAEPEAPQRGTGRIEGVVRYVADSERPWRFSRYYIKESRKGNLAEAVVALNGSKLTAPARDTNGTAASIDQVDFQFVPETVAIRAGDSVRFSNSDESVHNVMTSDGGQPFNINMPKNGEYVHAFEAAGGISKPARIGCVYHGGMRAWIYTFDHPWFQVTGRDGRFQLENVPAGEYTLEMIHPAGRLVWSRKVEIGSGETIKLEIVVSPDNIGQTRK